jgi:hypothetical protein
MGDFEDLESDALPVALTWEEYIARWVKDLGGWTQLANALLDRAGDALEISQDPGTIERGLRRLATRGHKPGGQYGRWMLRYFGFASPVEELVKWMGQFHTRFADLPTGIRFDHLRLWNRPPVSESRAAAWIELGCAHVLAARGETAACHDALVRAERAAPRAGPAAELELALVQLRVQPAREPYPALLARLDAAALSVADDRAYRAQLHDQWAQLYSRAQPGEAVDLAEAEAHYAAIVDEPYIPFVAYRKCVGLAYCAWQRGDHGAAVRLAELAVEHAGDAGLLRMRVTALNMLTRVLSGDAATATNQRARRIATVLEDEDLLNRVEWTTPPA